MEESSESLGSSGSAKTKLNRLGYWADRWIDEPTSEIKQFLRFILCIIAVILVGVAMFIPLFAFPWLFVVVFLAVALYAVLPDRKN